MGELIKRQDAINAVMQNYCYESDRMTALQELPVITDEKIRNEAIINYSEIQSGRIGGKENYVHNGMERG